MRIRTEPTTFRLSLALLLTFSVGVAAEEIERKPDQPESIQTLTTQLKTVELIPDLDATAKAKVIEAYKQALASATSSESFKAKAESFKAQANEVASLLSTERAKVSQEVRQPSVNAAGLELKELDQIVRQKSVELERLKQDLTEATDAIADREKRLLDIPTAIANANTRLANVETELGKTPPEDQPKTVTEANSALLEQRRAALRNELDALKAENAWHVANGELLPVRRDVARQQLDRHQAELARWQQAAREKREDEVDRAIRDANDALEDLPAPLKPLGDANLKAAKLRRLTEEELQRLTNEQSELQNSLKKLEQQFARAQQEANAEASVSQAIGEVLRERRIELRNIQQQLPNSESLQPEISQNRLQLFLLREELADLEDIEEATSTTLAELEIDEGFREQVRKQLEFRTQLVKGLIADRGDQFEMLAQKEGTVTGLKSLTKGYAQFIDERVLWIRSADIFGIQQFTESVNSAQAFAMSPGWKELPSLLAGRCLQKPYTLTVALAALIPVLIVSKRLRTGIRQCGEKAKSGSCRDFGFTWRATLLTSALALVWPAAFYLFGLWLSGGRLADNRVATQLAAGFLTGGAILLPVEFWRQSARKLGLMESHFGVAPNATELLRRSLPWLTFVLTPLCAFAAMVRTSGNPIHEQSLGRLAFVTSMLVLAFFLHRVGHPRRGIVQSYLARRPDSILFKSRFVLYWLTVATPLAFAVIAIVGYQFTAEQLAVRLLWSCFLVLGIWFLRALALRWVVLSRRRLAIEQARARLAMTSEQTETDPITAEAQANLEEIDLSSVDQQTRRLVRAVTVVVGALAIWSLWVDVLPALSKLGDGKAWDVSVATIAADSAANDGAAETATTQTIVDEVTYGEVFKAIAIFGIMVLAMRDVPGLLELVLLQRLPLDVALRFAITTLTRYVIFVVGMVWALGTIHIGWSKVQWLLAGVGVGLGFGLQEIFANFVSGLIILFERPLRAGDIVTIDGVTGTVKSVRMRATIIQDLDRKDFIVPNKDFITGRLLNWTLSDEVSRIVVPVGVAYGSDTDNAKELMLSAATEHELIVQEPPPQVTFEQFGDSSLNLVLRCFISLKNMPSRLKIIDELHSKIDALFRDANIEIPFPQRDLHLRSSDVADSIALNGTRSEQDVTGNKGRQ